MKIGKQILFPGPRRGVRDAREVVFVEFLKESIELLEVLDPGLGLRVASCRSSRT